MTSSATNKQFCYQSATTEATLLKHGITRCYSSLRFEDIIKCSRYQWSVVIYYLVIRKKKLRYLFFGMKHKYWRESFISQNFTGYLYFPILSWMPLSTNNIGRPILFYFVTKCEAAGLTHGHNRIKMEIRRRGDEVEMTFDLSSELEVMLGEWTVLEAALILRLSHSGLNRLLFNSFVLKCSSTSSSSSPSLPQPLLS